MTALHSPATAPVIEFTEASGPGALSGWEVQCPACGDTFRTSFQGTAEREGREHVEYMIQKERAAFPDQRIAQALVELDEIVARNPHLTWGSK